MSTDLYRITVDYVGSPGPMLEELPWLAKGVRAMAKAAKLETKGQSAEQLLESLKARALEAGAKGAARALPVGSGVDKDEAKAVKEALLDHLFPSEHVPTRALARLTVAVAEDGQNIPGKYAERILLARALWLKDENHPLRARFDQQRVFASKFTVPGNTGLEAAFTSRSKAGAPLYAYAPADWFTCLTQGETFGTTAWA